MINTYNTDNSAIIENAVNGVLNYFDIDIDSVQVEFDFLDKEEMQTVNLDTRKVDAPTDVLSFPTLEKIVFPFDPNNYPDDVDPETNEVILGEILICTDIAIEQAQEYNHSLTRELAFLACHGMLHLLGYDHMEPSEETEMNRLQEVILEQIGITRDTTDDAYALIHPKAEIVEELTQDNKDFRCGHVAVLGRPNAGKSTLINSLVGEKVSIVSWKPQTTRDKILGIANSPNAQIILIDTPGLHAPKNRLGEYMMKSVTRALNAVDAIIYIVDCEKGIDQNDTDNINRYIGAGKATVVAVNKIDHVTVEAVGRILTVLNGMEGIKSVVPISALRNKNVEVLRTEVIKLLSESAPIYPEDMYTDKNMRFITSEIIREKTLRLLDKEVPYGIGVNINKYEMRPDGKILDIDADIVCEKAAHKPIILGKGGLMIKKISTYARQDLEEITGSKIFLTLWVRVKEDWRDSDYLISEFGYVLNKED